MAALLLEIGLEEIPAGMIAAAQSELEECVAKLITRERLADDALEIASYSTPRRLAVLIRGVLPGQADMEEQIVGPSLAVAYKDKAPTPAALAFAKKAGVDVAALTSIKNAKGEYVAAAVRRKGRGAAELLASELPGEIAAVYWPKNMYWRAGKPERFIRPVRWIVALLDDDVLPLEFAGIRADGISYGHRVLHGDKPVVIRTPSEYVTKLEQAFVLADPAVRRHRIRKALDAITRTIRNARWREDEALIETVTHLTEWPTVVLGNFDKSYLELPEEVLVTVMRDHQKYFALEDASGKLLPSFLTVLNTQADEAGVATIRHGNERVLRARFNDARFFWDMDQKIPLADRVELLKNVTFQKDLGSYWDKTQQNIEIATKLSQIVQIVTKSGFEFDANVLKTATLLAKADLTSEVVKEFTDLQGIVGGLYANVQGFGVTVARAIYTQYQPSFKNSAIPDTIEGQILGLADRIQTITAMFSIGLAPSGSKDPFALRRAANAIVKILVDSRLPISISDLISSIEDDGSAEWRMMAEKCKQFFHERIKFYLQEVRGYRYDSALAAMAAGADDVGDVVDRTASIEAMRVSDDFMAISAAFKRMRNILSQAGEEQEVPSVMPDPALLRQEAEKNLFTEASAIAEEVKQLRIRRKYLAALEKIASLRPAVDVFFDQVLVMAPEADLRGNRLALLQRVLFEFSRIADFSQIVAEATEIDA